MDQAQPVPGETKQEFQPYSSSKLPLILIGLALILAAGFGGAYLGKFLYAPKTPAGGPATIQTTPTGTPSMMPTIDPIASWKTYTNTQYGFSFRHPNLDDFTDTVGIAGPQEITNPKPVVQFADKSTITMPNTDAAFDGFAVYVVPNSKKYTLSEYVRSQREALTKMFKEFRGSGYNDQTQESSFIIDNQQTVLLTNTGDHVERVYVIYPDSQKFLVIGKIQTNVNFKNTFDQILFTFRFLK